MGNILSIESTEFRRNNGSTYGLCIYDDYDKQYYNQMTEEEFNELVDEKEILEFAEVEFSQFFIDLDAFNAIEINGLNVLEKCDECESHYYIWQKTTRMFEDMVGNGLSEYETCPNCMERN